MAIARPKPPIPTHNSMQLLAKWMGRIPLLREKLLCLTGLGIVFGFFYSGAQRLSLRPVSWLEIEPAAANWIPVNFGAIWLYLSLYPLIGLAAFLITDRRLLWRFGIAMSWLGIVSSLFFVFLPTGVPRPAPHGASWAYSLVTFLDEPVNAFPSLHASLAIVSGLFCHRLIPAGPLRMFQIASLWLWIAAIFWSCIALRQHTCFDLAGGALLGFPTGWIALHAPYRASRASVLA